VSHDFRFLMIGAMYENGGNTTQRLLDGHPQLHVYPFESQLGTALVKDHLASMFPVKYRWPVFALDATPRDDYRAIIDEEVKVRARTPHVSKFRHAAFDFDDEQRRERFEALMVGATRSRAAIVERFFRATFDTWRNVRRSGEERVYVGYSPIVVVDADRILDELPQAHFLHVVRNPWSAFADTKKRPVPMSLASYTLAWTINQHHALLFRQRYPDRMHIVRFEDVVGAPEETLGQLCRAIGLDSHSALATPSWNGSPLDEVYPWGTIRRATPAANKATAEELSPAERDEIRQRTSPFLEALDYQSFC
jgi:hypothetical protein